MPGMPRFSLPERVAEHLREGIRQGRWSGQVPGVPRLAEELNVAPRTVRRALDILEADGLLGGRGLGRSRSITAGAGGAIWPPLRVAILRHDASLTDDSQTSAVSIEIMHSLEAAGHTVFFCNKSQIELRHEVRRIVREMAKTPADAWIVEAGSRPLLEWCAGQSTVRGIPIRQRLLLRFSHSLFVEDLTARSHGAGRTTCRPRPLPPAP